MMRKNPYEELELSLGKGRVKKKLPLASLTTFRLGGQAEFYFEAKSREDLIKAYQVALKLDLPFFLLGGGSNVVILSKKIRGLVVRNLYIEKKLVEETNEKVILMVSSGYPTTKLVYENIGNGFAGLEYHLGLPGTVGGAIYMNSKWTKPLSYFSDNLITAEIVDKKGKIKTVTKDYFQFAYDFSILQKTKELLLTATFNLKKEDENILKRRGQMALNYRKKTQPMAVFSSGCFFKNVNGKSAGYLIDQCGLKGYSCGDFYVSEKHANFIINRGKGKSADLTKLTKYIKKKVKEKFGVELKEEVIVI
jgi:UDP-N-acetylmuramate dehydrogenase